MEKLNRWRVFACHAEHGAAEKGSYQLLKEAEEAAEEFLYDNESVMIYDALNHHIKTTYGYFPTNLLPEIHQEGEAESCANE